MTVPDNGILSRRALIVLIALMALEVVVMAVLPPPSPPWVHTTFHASLWMLIIGVGLHFAPRDKQLWIAVASHLRKRWRLILPSLFAAIFAPLVVNESLRRGISGMRWWMKGLAVLVVLALVFWARGRNEDQN